MFPTMDQRQFFTMDSPQTQTQVQCRVQKHLALSKMAVLLVVLFSCPGLVTCSKVINVAVLLPFDDSYLFSYRRVAPAVEMTVAKVNKDRHLLRHHRIYVRYSDSKCDIAVAMNNAFNFYKNEEVNVFLGPVCDFAVAPVARQIRFWNVPMVSTGAMAMDFGTFRSRDYPLLTRVGPVHFGTLSYFFSALATRFKWKKIKLLYSRHGQDYLIKSFCHLAVEALHYTLKDIRPDLGQDYYKLSEEQTQEDVENLLADEVGLEYGGWCLSRMDVV